MKKIPCSFLLLLFVLGLLLPGRLAAEVIYDPHITQLAFAAQELEGALKEAGRDNLQVTLIVKPDESSPEAFQIRSVGPAQVWIAGSDATGAMYGGLEVADLLRLGLPIEDQDRAPFVGKRGIKFNIPLDARTPSYDDTGDSAQNNIETVWDFEFWKAYLDDLARYRYNVLSLWTTHPYPSIIKLEEYPEVALDDVYRIGVDIYPHYKNKLQDFDLDKPGTLKLVKKMSIEEKIAHWQRVFQYAEDRGIEIYLFHWNVFTFGATGKHGITQDQTNPVTVEYLRKCVRQALLTYPQITGIGVTAGENADRVIKGKHSTENFIFNTYGRGIMDVLEQQPDRKVRFIFRRHVTDLKSITAAFADYPGVVESSVKYAVAHIYSMRRPQMFEERIRDDAEKYQVKVWLNLRNDDIFVHRWGNPDFVRDYMLRMPHYQSPGFYMGSDGYVWAREFITKNPEMAGKLEIDKHWYRFRQWGQLAYNPELGRDYWEATLRHRFPGVDAKLLYDAWAATSEIIPQVNRACYAPTDGSFAPEGCMQRQGFLTVDDYYFDRKPMSGSGGHSVTEWAKAVLAGEKLEGITPLQASDNLDEYAATALDALPELRAQMGDNLELQETLNDIESMAHLGRYYADKMRGAAKLAVFREDREQKQFHDEAVAHFKDAVEEWKAYAAVVSSQYKTQLMARTHYMDWNSLLKEVEKEVVTVQHEGDFPEVRFVNLEDGAHLPAETDLRVEVDATDGDGIRELKLYLNGLLLKAQAKSTEPQVWSSSSDEFLKAMKPGMYHLEAVAEDKTGVRSWREIQISVGDVSENSAADWRDEIHQVILNQGERLMVGDVRDFPRLECYLKMHDNGKLVLHGGTPDRTKDPIWLSWSKDPDGGSHYAVLENARLKTYRGMPDNPEVVIWESKNPEDKGPYQLGITASRRLVIFSEVGEKRKIIWRSPAQD